MYTKTCIIFHYNFAKYAIFNKLGLALICKVSVHDFIRKIILIKNCTNVSVLQQRLDIQVNTFLKLYFFPILKMLLHFQV